MPIQCQCQIEKVVAKNSCSSVVRVRSYIQAHVWAAYLRNMVQVQGVQFQYGEEGPRMTFPDFSCKPGERMLLLGQSGTGKTTLLHLLCGMLKAQSGTLHVAGQI